MLFVVLIVSRESYQSSWGLVSPVPHCQNSIPLLGHYAPTKPALVFLITTQFLFTLLGRASPVDGTNPNPGLSWTGEVAGHGVVTLFGDAGSVEEQIFALNPSLAENYIPTTKFMSKNPTAYNASEVFVASDSSTYYYKSPAGDANGVAVRDDVNGAKKLSDGFRPIDWYCATFATGDGE